MQDSLDSQGQSIPDHHPEAPRRAPTLMRLSIIESILRDRTTFFVGIRDRDHLRQTIISLLVTSVILLALYGAVMGSTNSLWQVGSSAAKLPVLFLASLIVCAPALYFFNLIFGSSQSLSQNVALMLTAIATNAVVLVSSSPIILFFLLTSSNYQFFKLLNVLVFGVAGIIGVSFLVQGMRAVNIGTERAGGNLTVVRLWIIVYAFVGSQAAWTLRPFVGAPSMPFELFRPLGGNFFSNVFTSFAEFLGS